MEKYAFNFNIDDVQYEILSNLDASTKMGYHDYIDYFDTPFFMHLSNGEEYLIAKATCKDTPLYIIQGRFIALPKGCSGRIDVTLSKPVEIVLFDETKNREILRKKVAAGSSPSVTISLDEVALRSYEYRFGDEHDYTHVEVTHCALEEPDNVGFQSDKNPLSIRLKPLGAQYSSNHFAYNETGQFQADLLVPEKDTTLFLRYDPVPHCKILFRFVGNTSFIDKCYFESDDRKITQEEDDFYGDDDYLLFGLQRGIRLEVVTLNSKIHPQAKAIYEDGSTAEIPLELAGTYDQEEDIDGKTALNTYRHYHHSRFIEVKGTTTILIGEKLD